MTESLAQDARSVSIAVGVIELVNRSGQVTQRVRWDGSKLRVGRAYDNDIIISDSYVCPHHVELLTESGCMLARDLGSVNGIYSGKKRKPVKTQVLNDGAVIHLGHSQLQFHLTGGEVAATWRDSTRQGPLSWLGKPWLLLLASFVALMALAADAALDSAEHLQLLTMASDLLYPLIAVLIWAGFWALLNRVLTHQANFQIHLAISFLGVAGLFFSNQVVALLGFALSLDDWVPWLKLFSRIVVLMVVIYTHLRYATIGSMRRQVVVATLASMVMFGTPEISEVIERNEFSSLPYLEPLLRPPAYRFTSGETIEVFFDQAQKLREKADRDVIVDSISP
jgi:hypothetical protein